MAVYPILLYLNLGSRICGPMNSGMGKVRGVKKNGMFHTQMLELMVFYEVINSP